MTAVGSQEQVHIQFDSAQKKMSGYAGCNRFFGPYEQGGDTALKFGNLGSTVMTCPDMSVEQAFFAVLAQVDSYVIRGDTLSLHRARMAQLARFVATAS